RTWPWLAPSVVYSPYSAYTRHAARGASNPGRKGDPARQRLIRIKTLPGFSPHAAGLSPLPAAYFAERRTPKTPGVDPASRSAHVVRHPTDVEAISRMSAFGGDPDTSSRLGTSRYAAYDAVDGAHSAASRCHRVVASKRTTLRGAVHGRG